RPQATLNLAASQAESGNPNTARGILENLIKSFPNSSAAAEAKDRLKALPRPAATAPAPAKAQQSK
ncbi:MAG: tetratricopeptide repeat protein, partial [Burkholderiales bacterium]